MGNQLIPYEVILEMFEVNSDSFKIVTREFEDEICVVIVLLPLTADASSLMMKNNLAGLSLQSEQIAPSHTVSYSAYLAVAAGISNKTRDYAVASVYTAQLMINYSLVVTRPTTQAGLNICQRTGFAPMNSIQKSNVGVLHTWKNFEEKIVS